ncbi:MAG: hypothetical protein K0U66_06095, partial [Gammaproteobacteria bacterium]|nr:hypothetical protein [Gammaproteobacteria bacterium]
MTENSNIGNLGLLRPDRGSELNFPELHARKDIGVAADVHNADAVIGCGDHAHSNGAKLSLGVIGSSLHYDRYTSLAVHAKSQERYADDGIEIQNSKQLDAFGEADISTFLLKANGVNPAPVKFNLHNGGGASTELASATSATSATSLTTVDLTKAPMLEGY